MLISDKQASFILDSDAFFNIADGAVRAGKTFAAHHRFAEKCITGPRGDMMLIGKTERTLRRNVISPMIDTFGSRVRYIQGIGEMHFAGRTIYVVGANNEAAESRVRGVTLASAYVNEITLCPKNVISTLIDRCSIDGAQIFADCNPDNPQHWLYTDYLTNAAVLGSEVKRWQFRLDDNPALSEEYKDRIKRLHSGIWYRRMILGEWCVAEGAVYDMFDTDTAVVSEMPELVQHWVAADYGTTNPTVFGMLSQGIDNRLYVHHEWRWDSRTKGRRPTDTDLSNGYRAWLADLELTPRRTFIDPSAASFIEQLYRDGVRGVTPADNAVVDGIRDVATLIANDRLRFHGPTTEAGIAEMLGYAWDEKAQQRGEDKPLKAADHFPDMVRYGVRSIQHVWRRWIGARYQEAA